MDDLRAAATGSATRAGLRHGDIGYVSLRVGDVSRAAAFFSTVLGWQYEPGSVPVGRQVVGRRLHHGLWGGFEHGTLFCCYSVDDVDAAAERVRAAGGTAGAPHQEPYGLIADCTDPEGTDFALFRPPGGTVEGGAPPDANEEGDLAYVTMEVSSSERARNFYGAVLGWRFSPGPWSDGWRVDGPVPMVGIAGGHPVPTTVPMYRVDDIAAAVDRPRRRWHGHRPPKPAVRGYLDMFGWSGHPVLPGPVLRASSEGQV